MRRGPSRRGFLAGAAAAGLGGRLSARTAGAQTATRLVYQTAWSPEPDEAGLYQAISAGIYAAHGLDVHVQPGGPQLNAIQIFLAGQADFITTDSFRLIELVRRGLPVVAVAAFYQKPPHAILSHPHAGNDTLADLKGKPILISANDRESFWVWLRAKYGYTDDQIRPYTFNMAPFLADDAMSMQGFVTNEPFQVERAGIKPVVHVLADNGCLAYYDVILTSPRLVAERPAVVQRFVDATIEGWHSYLHGDPRPANDAIKRGNPIITDSLIAYARAQMQRHGLLLSDDVKRGGLGAMSAAHWNAIYRSLTDVGAFPAGIDISQGFTLQFVNKHAATAS